MEDAACRFHTADHSEMVLETIEPREEHHTRLVVLRRRFEDSPRQRHRRIEDGVVAGAIAVREAIEGRGCCWGDRVKDAEQTMRAVAAIALDEVSVVEIVTGVHVDSGR